MRAPITSLQCQLATDGGALDADGLGDGRLRLAPSGLTAVGAEAAGAAAPERWSAGDVLVGIDGETLDWYLVRSGPEGTAAAGGGR